MAGISEVKLGSAPAELGRIIGSAPPIADVVLRCGTRLTPRWGHGELHDYLGGLDGHVIGTYYGPAQDVSWKCQAERLTATTKVGSITVLPMAHDGHWDFGGEIGVSYVFLTNEHLQLCSDKLTGKPVELVRRLAFDDPTAATMLQLLGRESLARDSSTSLFVEQATDLLCLQLIRGHSSSNALAAERTKRGLAQWQVKKVTGYMREHMGAKMGLDELAELVGVSRFHLLRAFRLATGRTPHDWLTALRMERACQLLRQRHLKITEIGLAVGYETPSSFASAFRTQMGMTATDFRRHL